MGLEFHSPGPLLTLSLFPVPPKSKEQSHSHTPTTMEPPVMPSCRNGLDIFRMRAYLNPSLIRLPLSAILPQQQVTNVG